MPPAGEQSLYGPLNGVPALLDIHTPSSGPLSGPVPLQHFAPLRKHYLAESAWGPRTNRHHIDIVASYSQPEGWIVYMCPICGRTIRHPAMSAYAPDRMCRHGEQIGWMEFVGGGPLEPQEEEEYESAILS